MERRLETTISPAAANQGLLEFLAGRFTYLHREAWAARLSAGQIRVNGSRAASETRLRPGDRVTFRPGEGDEPPVARDYAIVHAAPGLLVVVKPAGLPCHPAGRYFRHTLWALLRQREGVCSPAFLNRLDRETSGLVLVGTAKEAVRRWRQAYQDDRTEKRYLVMVEGVFPEGRVHAYGRLVPDVQSPVRKKRRFVPLGAPVNDGQGDNGAALPCDRGRPGETGARKESARDRDTAAGQTCATRFYRLATAQGLSLLEAFPDTGRTHQIRATLSSLGFPVVGDKIYGVDDTLFLRFMQDQLTPGDRRRLRLPRQALHLARISVPDPATGHLVTFQAPVPDDLRGLMECLAGGGKI